MKLFFFFRIYFIASAEKFKVGKIYVVSKLVKLKFFGDELITNFEIKIKLLRFKNQVSNILIQILFVILGKTSFIG